MNRSRMMLAAVGLAAVSSVAGASPWITQTGMSAADYQDYYDNQLPAGYRPIALSVNGTPGSPRYAAVWINDGVPASDWAARHGLTADEYQAEAEALFNLGFRIISVDVVGSGADARFAAAWVKDSLAGQGDWDARHNLTSDQYNSWTNDMFNQGLVPIWVSGYGEGAGTRFAAVYVKNVKGWSYAARHGMSASEYQDEVEDRIGDGFRLICTSAYGDENDPTFAAIWVLPDGPNWDIQPEWLARHGESSAELQTMINDLSPTRYQPVCIEEYGPQGARKYAHIWFEDLPGPVFSMQGNSASPLLDDAVKQFMTSRKISRGALAVTYNGKLVHNKAYTYMHPSAVDTTTDARFRLASVSKPLTAIGVMRLLELNPQYNLNTRMIDVLPPALAQGWMDQTQVNRITLGHLLSHRGGWDDASPTGHTYEWPLGVFTNITAFDPLYGDFRITNTLGVDLPMDDNEIITYMKRVYLDNTPGTFYAYSNFGYFLLGKVIETVSGQSYEDFMRDNVFCPVGAGLIEPGFSAEGDALPNEVKYRDAMNRWWTTKLDESGDLIPTPYGGHNMEVRTPNGGWVASAKELARVTNAFTNKAASPLLLEASIDDMWTGTAQNAGYGLGWILSGAKVWHNGAYNGTRTFICRRNDGITFTLLFNQRAPSNTPVDGQDNDAYTAVNDAIDAIQAMGPIGGAPPWPTWDLFGPGSCGTAPTSCPFDLTGDGVINAADLAVVLASWGPNAGHPADFNNDGFVNAADLGSLLASWGPCRRG